MGCLAPGRLVANVLMLWVLVEGSDSRYEYSDVLELSDGARRKLMFPWRIFHNQAYHDFPYVSFPRMSVHFVTKILN